MLESGHAVDVNFGGYGLVAGPRDGADWQIKFGVSLFLPSRRIA